MNNSSKNIRNLLLPASFFVPFTFYFFLFGAGAYVAYLWLMQHTQIPGTLFSDMFHLLLHIAIWFMVALLAVALLTVGFSLMYFLIEKSNGNIKFFINTSGIAKNEDGNQKQGVHLQVSPMLKPFLGFVKLRLKYDGDNYTEKFALAQRSQRKMISTTLDGDYTWSLPEIKEYHLEKVIIYFEDFFQFFSFAVPIPVTDHFYTPPTKENAKNFAISPRKTEDTETRIEELKRVEGEFINYKNFENNDDVRRIVWKIYAKNKELVVRIPEILDPYASQAYLYVSFYNHFNESYNSTVDIYFLNYFKTITWAIYQKLAEQGFEIKYIPDQHASNASFTDEKKMVEYTISTSDWQTDKDIKSYVNMKDASVVVVTSLADAGQVGELLSSATGSTFFVLIKLSNSLQRSYLVGLLKWLFIQQEKNELEKYKTNWQLSLLRPKITQNEKKLAELFSKYDKTLVI